MAVDNQQLKIDPYTSTVPLVQMPVQDMEANTRPGTPLPGQFGKKGTGALEIGDALFKGIMQGHQIKEQRKAQMAQATIAAADSATHGAYQQYQDALAQAGGKTDDPKAQAAYKAYSDVFNQAKATKAKFVIPEKPAKGEKKDKKAGAGFSSIKDFFEANPHVVPQIALMTMQPRPQGMSPETTQATQESKRIENIAQEGEISLNDAKRKEAATKRFDAGAATFEHLTADEVEALPSDKKKEYEAWQHDREIAVGYKSNGKAVLWTDDKGNYQSLPPGEVPPAGSGFKPYSKPSASGGAKLGTLSDFISKYAAENKLDPNTLPSQLVKYLKDDYAYKQATTSSSSSAPAHLDAAGNQVAGSTSTTRGTPAPKPPAGFAPVGGSAAVAPGAMTAPPTPPSAVSGPRSASTGTGRMTAPPSGGAARGTWQQTQNTQKVETEKSNRYTTAQKTYDAALKTNAKTFADDPKGKAEADKAAYNELMEAHKGIEDWYNKQVHAVRGSVPSDKFKVSPMSGGKVKVEVEGQTITFKSQQDADNFMREAAK